MVFGEGVMREHISDKPITRESLRQACLTEREDMKQMIVNEIDDGFVDAMILLMLGNPEGPHLLQIAMNDMADRYVEYFDWSDDE